MNTRPRPRCYTVGLTLTLSILSWCGVLRAEEPTVRELVSKSRRVMFLGDSITAAGQYIAYFDAWLVTELKDKSPKLIDCGLPSETVSGLSEDGHAGGQFPRPDLAERLDRVLKAVQPDLVVACYGINCGIYLPFDNARLAKYQEGMKKVKAAVEKSGAKFIVMTPPFYDDLRSPKKFSYNEVLDQYSDWLISQRKDGWTVIDLHGPMTRAIQDKRKTDPQYTMQPDGVHPNDAGHWFVAQNLIRAMGDEKSASAESAQAMLAGRHAPEGLLPLVQQRMSLLRDSYVSAAGHLRPGVAKGLPVAEAEAKAAMLSEKIAEMVGAAK
ncbi:MAG: SGNH/GDSL hydrolase family protein [Planctomycetes bacterium]|nr:SGNH/GDSL hydrolase family protein [Planctomycetota bacterium]